MMETARSHGTDDASALRAGAPVDPMLAFQIWARAMRLSPREREITALVIRGLRNKEVARVLACSDLTVRNHLCSIFRKVGVSTRAELTFLAIGEGGASADGALRSTG